MKTFSTTLRVARTLGVLAGATALALLSACGGRQGYGVVTPQAEAQMAMRADDAKLDTPAMYLALIRQMQEQGKYYASLAHVDAYEKAYGANAESTLLRADALRATAQPEAAATAYRRLLRTPLAAQGHRGLGLLAGEAGDFGDAAVELRDAARLAPTDATTLSDLGYALLRSGEPEAARVPLLQALQLDDRDARIVGNVAVLMTAQGRVADAQALMRERNLSAAARVAVTTQAALVIDAARARDAARAQAPQPGTKKLAQAARVADGSATRTPPIALARADAAPAASDANATPWGLATLAPRLTTAR